MGEVMAGHASDAQIAGLLMGLAMKGERPAEIVGLARTMRAHAVPLSRRFDRVFDTCGTGGDRAGTFNISSCAAVVVADRTTTKMADVNLVSDFPFTGSNPQELNGAVVITICSDGYLIYGLYGGAAFDKRLIPYTAMQES